MASFFTHCASFITMCTLINRYRFEKSHNMCLLLYFRQLKNKDTGLDLIVSSYRETKGLMSSTVYYQVVLVSNLACFKTPSHKESDVVQYSVSYKESY